MKYSNPLQIVYRRNKHNGSKTFKCNKNYSGYRENHFPSQPPKKETVEAFLMSQRQFRFPCAIDS